jgi:hypothetical protein
MNSSRLGKMNHHSIRKAHCRKFLLGLTEEKVSGTTMKKLILSAFAMSLIFPSPSVRAKSVVDDFLSLPEESLRDPSPEEELPELFPRLEGSQHFSPEGIHQNAAWNVGQREVEIDKSPLRGQGHSLIPWSEQDPDEWLDIDRWLIQRSIKDKNPDWKLRLRDISHQELVGKILQCYGECQNFRGINSASVEYLSRIQEGDELKTGKNSVAWIYLMDGTLARVGPESAVSFQEINWSKKEVFYHLRLNQGHLYWHPRGQAEFPLEESPETDSLSLPLRVREANTEHFQRVLYQRQNDSERLTEAVNLDEVALKNKFEKLNALRESNNKWDKLETHLLVVTPNGSLIARDADLDLLHFPGDKTYFKKKEDAGEFNLQLRGYTSSELIAITESSWHEIEKSGRLYQSLSEPNGDLQILELLTKRIFTLELAREYWFEQFTRPVLEVMAKPKVLAVQHGYVSWSEKNARQRLDFLLEYTRRIETSNLKAMENLLERLKEKGEKFEFVLTDSLYREALNHYLLGLKTRYTDKKLQVREMSDLQYYIWILRHGKY